jgi:diacylglycerol kinase (ATP)
MTPRKAATIYNPMKVDEATVRSAISAEPGSDRWEMTWLPTSESDAGQRAAVAALEGGAELVIAAGGDGTVRAVAEVLVGTGVALALLPSGTGNLLARNLKLTLDDMAHSIHTAFTGDDRRIDAAAIELRRDDSTVDRHVFLVMAGAGIDAKIMAGTDPALKKRLGWLAYANALVDVLRGVRGMRFQYCLDESPARTEHAQALIVGNCGSLPANIMLLPDALVDDGLLDLIILKPESFRGWLAVVVKIFWENGVVKRTPLGRRMTELKSRSIDMRQARRVSVDLSRPETVQLDGDPFGEIIGCRVSVEPGSLIVKVPAG